MTIQHAVGKFEKYTYKVSGGLHGVGVSVVNGLSTYLNAEVHRDGKIFIQKFEKGQPVTQVEVVGESDRTGPKITFLPDHAIFQERVFSYDLLARGLQELAFLNKGLTLTVVDNREKDNGEHKQD